MSQRFKEVMEEYNNYLVELNKKRDDLNQKLIISMKEIFSEFLERNPKIEYITWTQYTPYFNDGDECVFSVHDMFMKLTNDDYEVCHPYDLEIRYDKPDSYIYDIAEGKEHLYKKYYTVDACKKQIAEYLDMLTQLDMTEDELIELNNNFNDFKNIISQLNDDVFKAAFGDHCVVMASKNGFNVEEYEHD